MSSTAATTTEPTLTEALAARGYTHRAAAHGAHDIVRVSDGVVVTTLKASSAWEWIHAFDLQVERNAKIARLDRARERAEMEAAFPARKARKAAST